LCRRRLPSVRVQPVQNFLGRRWRWRKSQICVGESLVGEGNEVAHIDLIMGPRGSAAETAFANCLVNNKDGFTSLLAVVAPNLLTNPRPVMFTTSRSRAPSRRCRCSDPRSMRSRWAVADSVAEGVIRRTRRQRLHLRRRVHPLGSGRRQEIQEYNYKAVKESIRARSRGFARGGRSRRQAQSGQASVRRLGRKPPRGGKTSGIRKVSFAVGQECSDCLNGRERAPHAATLQRRDVGSRQAAVMQRGRGKNARDTAVLEFCEIAGVTETASRVHAPGRRRACGRAASRSRSGPAALRHAPGSSR